MTTPLGKIQVGKVPASQAIPGNPEHAELIAKAQREAGSGTLADGPASKLNAGTDWAKNVPTDLKRPTLVGAALLALFVGGFGAWAATAPLAGAAIAPGIVSASGQNFKVQHFEGGIIDKILVKEGDRVVKDQPLMTLDPTEAESTHNRLTKSLVGLQARAYRLEAERDNTEIAFSDALRSKAWESRLDDVLEEQKREFSKRRDRYETDARILDQQITAFEEQITGLQSQTASAVAQIDVLSDEISVKEKLLKRRLTNRSEVLRLIRSRSEMEGRIGGYKAGIAEAKSGIAGALQRKSRLQAERAETAATALNEVRSEIADTQERISAAEAVMKRIVVRSPSDGVVVNISKNTPGSVVRQGEDLVVILPTGGELIVEARLSPLDVDVVNVGQRASLRFSSLNTRTTPEIDAKVTYVSADRLVDPATNEPYYTARLSMDADANSASQQVQIFPGMPVETYIETGNRTFFEYLGKPLTDSFSRAFREE
ncbi:MAG: HlyD family type I secretion periplasmic adaptor subunit [Pseudomonadota bacterium]